MASPLNKGIRLKWTPTSPLDPEGKQPKVQSSEDARKKTEALALDFLRKQMKLLGIEASPGVGFAVRNVMTDRANRRSVRVRQLYLDIPVFGAEINVQVDPIDRIVHVGGNFVPIPKIVMKQKISKQNAMQIALKSAGRNGSLIRQSTPVLEIFPETERSSLVWHLQVRGTDEDRPALWECFVHANTGEMIYRYNNLQTLSPAIGNGLGARGEYRVLNTASRNKKLYYLTDLSRGMANGGCIKSFDFKNLEACKIGQLIHDRDTSSTSDNRWVKTNERALADLHHNLGIVYEYFRLYHGHDSFDGKGKTICALAHVGTKMNDAYWDPALDIIVFGDGDGNTTKGFTSALDIVAHEFTHGITQHTAGLIYDDESGALNESFSDVFGALIDDNDWIIGEAATLNGKGLRSMSDPSRCGSYSKKDSWGELERKGMPQPVRKGDYYETLRDHRGVHINSGIPNKVAFLIAEGGTHDGNAIRGIGRRATAAIYYRALAFILTPSTDFADLRDALETACRIEFPGDERKLDTVSKALKSVGL